MPKRVNSSVPMIPFVPLIPSAFFVVVALGFIVCNYSPARADNTCLEQPNQPATDGARWHLRYDRTKGRKCWVLVEAAATGRDATAPQGQPSAASTFSSQLAALFGNLTGASPDVSAQSNAPQGNATSAPRKTQGNAANTNKPENGARADQRDNGERHAVKRAAQPLTEPEREALFEEFLRW